MKCYVLSYTYMGIILTDNYAYKARSRIFSHNLQILDFSKSSSQESIRLPNFRFLQINGVKCHIVESCQGQNIKINYNKSSSRIIRIWNMWILSMIKFLDWMKWEKFIAGLRGIKVDLWNMRNIQNKSTSTKFISRIIKFLLPESKI